MFCEYCTREHSGEYASGRFCSYKCSRGFSTKAKRKEINASVGAKLRGKIHSEETRERVRESWLDPNIRAARSKKTRTVLHTGHIYCSRVWVFKQKPERCESCGTGPHYNGKPLVLQIHHVDGNNRNNKLENLQILCPNCHSQTDNFGGRGKKRSKTEYSSARPEHSLRERGAAG